MLTPAATRDVEILDGLLEDEEQLEVVVALGPPRGHSLSLDCQSGELEVDTLAHLGPYQPGDPAIMDLAQKE